MIHGRYWQQTQNRGKLCKQQNKGSALTFLFPDLFEAKCLLANTDRGVHSLHVFWEKFALIMPMWGNAVPCKLSCVSSAWPCPRTRSRTFMEHSIPSELLYHAEKQRHIFLDHTLGQCCCIVGGILEMESLRGLHLTHPNTPCLTSCFVIEAIP